MSKFLWFDTEATGLSERSAIIQIAGIIAIDDRIKEKFNFTCKPFPDSEISQETLKINGKTETEIMSYPDPFEVHDKLTAIFAKYINKFDKTDKFTIAGQNVSFDLTQLSRFFTKCNDKFLGSWINYKEQFDTLNLFRALQITGAVPVLENNQLETIAKFFNLEIKAHDAMADIEATYHIGTILISLLTKYIPMNVFTIEDEMPF
jgi:DNA polymerase-3 subunit epsilon